MILIKNGTINTITNGVFVGDILIEDKKIIRKNECYYLKELWEAEEYVADKIVTLASKDADKYPKMENYINGLEKDNNITYNPKHSNIR